MEYIVAKYRKRTTGNFSDIAACGVKGFAPFTVEADATQSATLDLYTECNIDKSDFTLTELSRFGFEEEVAECALYRHSSGYLFEMVKGSECYLFAKEDNSPRVESNYGLYSKVDASLLRFGLWMMFGLCTVPLGAIAIHSSVLVKDDFAVLCLGESGTGKSTHTRLWREHIDGAFLLNDDSPFLRVEDGKVWAYGSPWSGKTPCYKMKDPGAKVFKTETILKTFVIKPNSYVT